MPHTKVGKNKCSNIIYLNLVNLMIYHQIQLTSIKSHLKLRKFGKTCKKTMGKLPPLKLKSEKWDRCISASLHIQAHDGGTAGHT